MTPSPVADRRRHRRAPLARSAELHFAGLAPVELRLLDLSPGGLRGIVNLGATGDLVAGEDTAVDVTLRVPGFLGTRRLSLPAAVVRVGPPESSGARELGLAFRAESRALTRFVRRALRVRRRLDEVQGGATPVAEALRQIRVNLGEPDAGRARVVLVTSSVASEGKSFISGHLGPLLAGEGRRVLLVDADLRAPSLHTAFGVPAAPGLADVLAGGLRLGDAAVTTHMGVALLPVGSSGDLADTWSPVRAEELVGALRQSPYDYVVIDSPPLLASAIGSTLAHVVDDVLLVARSGVTRSRDLREARLILERRGAPLRGIVLNDHAAASRHAYGSVGSTGPAPALPAGAAAASDSDADHASKQSNLYDLAGTR